VRQLAAAFPKASLLAAMTQHAGITALALRAESVASKLAEEKRQQAAALQSCARFETPFAMNSADYWLSKFSRLRVDRTRCHPPQSDEPAPYPARRHW